MVPPRLSIVQSAEVGKPSDSSPAGTGSTDVELCDAALREAEPADTDRGGIERLDMSCEEPLPEAGGGPASPVHGLIATIAERTLEQRGQAAQSDAERAAALRGDLDGQEEHLRLLEAVLFAAPAPLSLEQLQTSLPAGTDVAALMGCLQQRYAGRGVNLVHAAGKWMFRTAEDLSWALQRQSTEERRLSKAALETLAIVAYHQPVTRAEIEEIRGVSISKGTLDVLMDTGWVRPRGRRRAPGKPVTYGTTEAFLDHFGLAAVQDLPGLSELKGAGLLDANLPPDFKVPEPTDSAALMPDELPLGEDDGADEDAQAELAFDEAEDDDDREDDVAVTDGLQVDAGRVEGPGKQSADDDSQADVDRSDWLGSQSVDDDGQAGPAT